MLDYQSGIPLTYAAKRDFELAQEHNKNCYNDNEQSKFRTEAQTENAFMMHRV